jgi:hypothetical protein
MILFKSIPFTFEDKDYEIKVFYNDTTINTLVFHNHYPVNGFRHQIKISKKLSVKELLERNVIDEIIEIARKDIFEKRWERLLKAS